MSKIISFMKLTRPVNSLIIGLAILLGGLLVLKSCTISNILTLLLTCISGILIASAGHVINDYVDFEIDCINAPYRPLPSGVISKRQALLFFFALIVIGNVLTLLINSLTFVIGLVASILLVAYSTHLKRSGFLGNLSIASLAALTFLFGGSSVVVSYVIVFPAIFAFFLTLGREILKGVEDLEGDKKYNVQTLAVHYGPKKAAIISIFLFSIVILISPFPWIFGYFNRIYLILALLVDIFLIISAVYLFSLKDEKIKFARKLSKLAMLTGILAF
ncbi:MAG: geranylgeranylglycerol-phosphate geranylgeranyltransferase, partial [Candidatus Asgardarchaeia archaeon]